MPVTIEILGGDRATIDGRTWSSSNASLAAYLDALTPAGGPMAWDPNPELTLARQAIKKLRGWIVSIDQPHRQETDPADD